MTLHLRVVSHSEVGLVRKNNQDSGYASAQLMVVADGMGGAAAGDLASAVAIEVIRRLVTDDTGLTQDATDTRTETDTSTETETETNLPPTGSENLEDTAPLDVAAEPGLAGRPPMLARFVESIAEANARIADLVAADYNLEGMGTTVTGAVFDGQRLGLAHIGDSRAYLLRDGTLERLTHDHSWVQSLVDDGKISAEEAAYHPHRSLLLKVLNGQPANDPDVTTVDLRVGDRLLFCSDGLCGLVDDSRIAELAGLADLDQAGTDLVSEALAEGGIDNITVILAEVLEGPDEAVGAGVAAGPTVLGAAAHREIPVVPRAPHAAPGPDSEDESPANARTADQRAARAGPARHPADDESRYAPRPPHRRRLVRTLLIGLAVLLVAGAGLGAGYAWTRTQYFVGAAGDQVAIYQGLPDGIPGLSLSQVYEVQQLPVATLPPYYQAQVADGIEVSSLDAARMTVAELSEAARRCAEPLPPPKSSPTPTSTSSASASARPPGSTPAASANPTPPRRPGC